MKSQILITNIKNIDFKENKVINNSQIVKQIHDSDMDIFTFENIRTGKQYRGNLMNVSVYDDLILENNEKFKILHMLTKNSF